MADTNAFGFDPSQLQGLLAQFAPTDEDKRRALTMALATAGFGILGAKGVNGMQAIGQGGQQGLLSYGQDLKDIQAQRMQNLQAGVSLGGLMKQQNALAAMQKFAQGDGSDQPPQIAAPVPGVSPKTAAQFGPQAQNSGFDASLPPAPMSAPQQGGFRPPNWRQIAPPGAAALAAASGDPKTLLDLVQKYSGTQMGPDGTVLAANGRPLYKQTDAGVQLFNPDGSPGQFMPVGEGNTQATAQRQAAIAGANTAATEKAKLPFTFTTLDLPGGGKQQVTAEQLQNILRGNNPTAGLPMIGDSTRGPLGQSPSPAQQAQNNVIAEQQGKDYNGIVDAERNAPLKIAKYNLLKDYYSRVDTGKAAPSVQSLKSFAAYFAPDLAKQWTKDTPYAQAAQGLSQEMALQLRDPSSGGGLPGSMSDSDVKILGSMIPSLTNDPRAIPIMADIRIAIEKRNQDIGAMARNYRKQNGKIDEGFYQQVQDFADSHPLFPNNLTGATGGASGTPKAATAAPGTTGTYKGKPVVMGPDGKWKYQ